MVPGIKDTDDQFEAFYRHQHIIEQLNSIFDNNMDSKAENISKKFLKNVMTKNKMQRLDGH
jgi:hypothetical protein